MTDTSKAPPAPRSKDGDAKKRATTPASGPKENRFVETREVFLAADLGGARLVETTRYWGDFADPDYWRQAVSGKLMVAEAVKLDEYLERLFPAKAWSAV